MSETTSALANEIPEPFEVEEMATTEHFQVYPNFFNSVEECIEAERNPQNTNPRYSKFTQTHFTAGDPEQFRDYRDQVNGSDMIPEIPEKNLFRTIPWSFYEKYRMEPDSVDNTFRYLFYKFKKGIFVKIRDGELKVFLPFSNKVFTNEWHTRIKVDPRFGTLSNFIRHVQVTSGYRFYENAVNTEIDTWYSNNCLVRYEYPIGEGDTNHAIICDMLQVLCRKRAVPDIEFFINRRDFPLLKLDGTEPYEDMFDSDSLPLLSHNYDTYAPILSMVESENFADIPIPTGDDWSRTCRKEGKYFPDTYHRTFDMSSDLEWKDKKSIAVFRGSSTGSGTTIETNPRLKIAYMSYMDTTGVLDAGITEWNARPRKLKGDKYLTTIEPGNFPFSTVKPLSPSEQASYKYIVHVPGHVVAYRLSLELSSGSCLLVVGCKYTLWYWKLLKPYVHYVPVKEDLSDLLEKIHWCIEHDAECQQIALNAQEFSRTFLGKKGILDYLQNLLCNLKKFVGNYRYPEPLPWKAMENLEKAMIKNLAYPKLDLNMQISQRRTYSELRRKQFSFSREAYEDTKEIRKSPKTFITLDTSQMVVRKKGKGLIHEAFIGLFGVNFLAADIPNFVYTFGYSKSELFLEYIPGMTLKEYIDSPDYNMDVVIQVMFQVILALGVAQELLALVHYDIAPWNIILRKLDTPREYVYRLDSHEFHIETSIVPVIIDVQRAHAVIEGVHYGQIDPFSFYPFHDCSALLLTVLREITQKTIQPSQFDSVFFLANLISPTTLTKLGTVKQMVAKKCRYSTLLDEGKREEKTPEWLALQFLKKFPKLARVSLKTPVKSPLKEKIVFPEKILKIPCTFETLLSREKVRNIMNRPICKADLLFLRSLCTEKPNFSVQDACNYATVSSVFALSIPNKTH